MRGSRKILMLMIKPLVQMLVVCLCVGSVVTLYFAPLVVNVEFNGEKFESPQPFQLTELTSQH